MTDEETDRTLGEREYVVTAADEIADRPIWVALWVDARSLA